MPKSKDIEIERKPKEISLRNLPSHFTQKDRLFIEKIVKENYRDGFLNCQEMYKSNKK